MSETVEDDCVSPLPLPPLLLLLRALLPPETEVAAEVTAGVMTGAMDIMIQHGTMAIVIAEESGPGPTPPPSAWPLWP